MSENQNTEETVDIRELLSELKEWYYFIGTVFYFCLLLFYTTDIPNLFMRQALLLQEMMITPL